MDKQLIKKYILKKYSKIINKIETTDYKFIIHLKSYKNPLKINIEDINELNLHMIEFIYYSILSKYLKGYCIYSFFHKDIFEFEIEYNDRIVDTIKIYPEENIIHFVKYYLNENITENIEKEIKKINKLILWILNS